MSRNLKISRTVLCMILVFLSVFSNFTTEKVEASGHYQFILLGDYARTLNVGEQFYLTAITSNGKSPRFSSSNSKVASVDTYGFITAKKSGSATITAKITNGEARCKVTVRKTAVKLNRTRLSLENGYTARLTASVSTGHPVTWKSSKKSIAEIDENGIVTAKKPGTTTITAKADDTTSTCRVTVKKPSVTLSKSSVTLYRNEQIKLSLSSTSKSAPKWKSNKKSVATVDENGLVTAKKHGTATITAAVDGVSRTCTVRVKQPTIRFSCDKLTLRAGDSFRPEVTVSSNIRPLFSSSNINVAVVDENGTIRARKKGRAYIYAKEDGVKASLILTVE